MPAVTVAVLPLSKLTSTQIDILAPKGETSQLVPSVDHGRLSRSLILSCSLTDAYSESGFGLHSNIVVVRSAQEGRILLTFQP